MLVDKLNLHFFYYDWLPKKESIVLERLVSLAAFFWFFNGLFDDFFSAVWTFELLANEEVEGWAENSFCNSDAKWKSLCSSISSRRN
jgi:hypothetical protein